MKDTQSSSASVPMSPALRRLSQIDLSFFSPSSPLSFRNHAGRVSPAFDVISPAKSPFHMQGPVGKSTRKRKIKPRLTKRTRQVLSFLENDESAEKENVLDDSSNKPVKIRPTISKTPVSTRKLAAMNLSRKQIDLERPIEQGQENSPYGADYDRYSNGRGDGKHFVPVYKAMPLYRRSERMDHNIKLGLDLHDYLIRQGLTPTRATRMARPYFIEDAQLRTPPQSLSPFRQSARILFGHDSINPTPKKS